MQEVGGSSPLAPTKAMFLRERQFPLSAADKAMSLVFLHSVVSTAYYWVQRAEKRLAARRMSAGLAIANSSECNTADDRLSTRPKGVPQIAQCCVAATRNMLNIPAWLRLALDNLRDSETDNIRLTRH